MIDDLQAIENGNLHRFMNGGLALKDPLITRRITVEKISSQFPDDVLIQLLNSQDSETAKHMGYFLPAEKYYLFTDEWLVNIELAKSTIKNNFDMPLAMIDKLYQHSCAEVRLAMVMSESFRWLAPDSVVTEFITSADYRVRMALADANISCEQAHILAADNEQSVRYNLACALSKLIMSQKSPRLSNSDIEMIAAELYKSHHDDDELINQLLIALPDDLQFQLIKHNVSLVDHNLSRICVPAIINFLLDHYSLPDLWEGFSKNKNITAHVKIRILHEAADFVSAGEYHLDEFETLLVNFIRYGEVNDELVMQAITCLDNHFNKKLFHAISTRTDLSPAVMLALDLRYRQGDYRWDWGVSLLSQVYASREQIEWLVRDWLKDDETIQALDKISAKNDCEWWEALAHSENDVLLTRALENSHTPSACLTVLGAHPELTECADLSARIISAEARAVLERRIVMLGNPALAPEDLQQWLIQTPVLAFRMPKPDKSILRQLALTGKTWQIRKQAVEMLEQRLSEE